MKFELLFLPDGDGCLGRSAEAYVCAMPSSPFEAPDPRAGHHLLTIESKDEAECHKQIDELINDLKKLKVLASSKFRRSLASSKLIKSV
jgi:hypothetical protein